MRIVWSLPVRGEFLDSNRGDLVRARCLIQALRQEGHGVQVVQDATRQLGNFSVQTYRQFIKRTLPKNLSWLFRDLGRWIHGRGHARRVARTVREFNADAIFETQVHFSGSGALASQWTGVPLLLDDCSPPSEEKVLGSGLPWLASHILKSQGRQAKVLIAVSTALKTQLLQEVELSPESVFLVPNGIDLKSFNALEPKSHREAGGESGVVTVGFVGSFQPWHRVDLLLESAHGLQHQFPLRLTLVGDGPTRPAILEQVQRLGLEPITTLTGVVPHQKIPDLISRFDIGMLPGSNSYGCPMKLLEYSAARVPSLAPDLAPIREVIQDGVSGLLFKPNQLDDLELKLETLIGDGVLRSRLAENARKLSEKCSWAHLARQMVAHLRRGKFSPFCGDLVEVRG